MKKNINVEPTQELTKLELLAVLEFVNSFAAKHDSRVYLNQIVTRIKNGVTEIIAADGHRITKVTLNAIYNLPTTISSESVVNAVKTKMPDLITDSGIVSEYPNIERLIPETYSFTAEPFAFNATYLAEACNGLAKASKKISGEKFHGVKFQQTATKEVNILTSSLANGRAEVLIGIMPMRL